ncbi:MAG: glycosyltransferase [Oscillospiraceae bacterium]|nr:glycosyltransferase [Oscillospiraceae bacterium]
MKVAIFSPLNPKQSGISDFTEEVVFQLKNYVDIDLFVDNYIPSNSEINDNYYIYNFSDIDNPQIREKYDFLIYHIGNNSLCHKRILEYSLKYPGIVELHDFSIHLMIVDEIFIKENRDEYIDIMKYCHGKTGEFIAIRFLNEMNNPPWEKYPLLFPINKHVLENAKGIIVHSDFTKQMIKGMGLGKPIKTIQHHTHEIIDDYEKHQLNCRSKLGIDTDLIMLASFGFASSPKRIIEILKAIDLLKKVQNNFRYYIVGELQIPELYNEIEKYNLTDHIYITGYVDLDDFKTYLGACDISFNLRYPTQGESSGSLHRALGMGKVVFVTKGGSFDECPSDVVIKIEADQYEVLRIYSKLLELLNNENELISRKEKAVQYAHDYCSLDKNCMQYTEFLTNMKNGSYKEDDNIDKLVDILFDFGLYSESYISELDERIGCLLS